jgi:aspartate kinase
MTLLVQKFGGSSVGTIEKIRHVADLVMAERHKGHDVVVVLSAMGGETDRLINLAHAMHADPSSREYDMLVSTGEQVSTALLAIALQGQGVQARALTGWQAGVVTEPKHRSARIKDIDTSAVMDLLEQGIIPVVTGFQGHDANGNVTTLGRGGSDTTAVALAARLGADACHIYTDVDGVYTTDPRVEPSARRLDKISFEEMLELASLGAKVLQTRAVEFAGKYNVPLKVLSTFVPGPGTIITYEEDVMESPVVSGVVYDRNQAKISLLGVPDKPGISRDILKEISERGIDIDMIVQNIPSQDGTIDFSFSLMRDDYNEVMSLMEAVCKTIGATSVVGDDHIVKLSVVGLGMKSHAGVASKMFEVMGDAGINIQMIATSEIKISVVIDEKYTELGVRSLHSAFGLEG